VDSAQGVWTYFAVFGSLVAAGFGFPIPEELPVIAGGALAAHASTQVPREHPYWYILWPVCILGVVISDGLLYGIGRFGGKKLLDLKPVQRLIRPEKRAEIEENFHKYGIMVLLGARLLPGIRAGVFITAGSLRMPLAKFLIADGIYAIPGVTLLFFLSFWFTDHFKDLFNRFHGHMESIVSLIVVIAIAAGGLYYLLSYLRRRVETGNPTEVPILNVVVKEVSDAAPDATSLTIPRPIYDAIVAQCREELPNECCGLLAGTAAGTVSQRFPLVNSAASPTRFESSPESMLSAMKHIREAKLEVLAVYHSHPSTPPTPSRFDKALNHDSGALTLIISMATEPPEVSAWNLDVDPPEQVPLTISDG
jgi:membrane protein DedA with SNARE-associated domain/proteasome lid subunit RPN8/RPN11